jgi:hypothetical protein
VLFSGVEGGFYRLGRGRELGFPEVAGAGKISGRGGSVDDVRSRGRVVGDAAPPLACWRRSLTSATARRRACWSGDREAVEELFLCPPAGVRASPTGARQRRGRGCPRVRLGHLGRTAVALLQWVGLPNFCPERVRHNARMKSNFEFFKNSNWSCQHIGQGFQKYFC